MSGDDDLEEMVRRIADDPVALRSQDALAAVESLVTAVDRAAVPVPRLAEAARLCARRAVLDEPAGESDLLLTVALATVLAGDGPAAVPRGVRRLVEGLSEAHPDQMELLREPRTWAWEARRLPPTDPAALTLLRLAARALPAGDPAVHDVTVGLSGRLLRLHRQEGGAPDRLAEAAERCRVALAVPGGDRCGLLTNLALVLLESHRWER
ncbi:hypothetical protein, partial [Streptomyces sp. NPDC005009]